MMYHHTMSRQKIAITIEERVLRRLDRLIAQGAFPNRSRAIGDAVEAMLDRLARTRLARESAKLDSAEERALAEEGMTEDVTRWPVY
jgi:Arc/MetJ-type ribon-helix-helix transcriptional regulator